VRIGPVTLTFADADATEDEESEPAGQEESTGEDNDRDTHQFDIGALHRRLDKLRPRYQAYRNAAEAMATELKKELRGLDPVQKRELIEVMLASMPEVAKEEQIREIARGTGHDLDHGSSIDRKVDLGMKKHASRLIPWARAPKNERDVELLLQRVVATLESFCIGFLGLRRGHDQFCEQTGIQVVRGLGPLHRAEDQADVLAYLLDWTPAGASRLQELRSVFTDVSMHQVALWEGMRAGMRALLKALSPEEIEIHLNSGKKWSPFKASARWDRFCELINDFTNDETMLASVFLGRDFVRAYSSVAGRKFDESSSVSISMQRVSRTSGTQVAPEAAGNMHTPRPLPGPRVVKPLNAPSDDDSDEAAVLESRDVLHAVDEDDEPEELPTNIQKDPRKRK
jgi:hypothetical protein